MRFCDASAGIEADGSRSTVLDAQAAVVVARARHARALAVWGNTEWVISRVCVICRWPGPLAGPE
ncbi:hypothetical protein GJR88_02473 [Dietzia sp. DQ12-45-1b]|nr:hypothetical protein GJR88_02473 [Dietzia sp. DQ12-45-1b]